MISTQGWPRRWRRLRGDENVPGNLRPSLPDARLSVSDTLQNGCDVSIPDIEPVVCNYGDEDGEIVAVLIGDFHAAHWMPALDQLAQRSGIRLIPLTKSGCSVADVALMGPRLQRAYTECAEWREHMLATVAEFGSRNSHHVAVIELHAGGPAQRQNGRPRYKPATPRPWSASPTRVRT